MPCRRLEQTWNSFLPNGCARVCVCVHVPISNHIPHNVRFHFPVENISEFHRQKYFRHTKRKQRRRRQTNDSGFCISIRQPFRHLWCWFLSMALPKFQLYFIWLRSAHTQRASERVSEREDDKERAREREGGRERGCTHRLLYSTNEWQASDTRTSNVSEKWNEKLSGFVLEIGLWQKGNCRQSKTVEWSHLAHALSHAICEWAEHTTW